LKLIVGHKNPDFDCFASCIAAQKLYPDHVVLISGAPQQNLSQFLGIYEEKYNYITESDLTDENVESLIVVDTAALDRLGQKVQKIVEKAARIIVYDHHPEIKEQTIRGEKRIENIGATVSLLVEEIMKRNIEIDSIDATLFAIAIYEDTGNLLYTSTTLRDLDAVKFLLQKGANLSEISEYIRYDLSFEQKQLLEQLLSNVETHQVDGLTVHVASAEVEKFVGGLGAVVSKLWNLENVETLVCIVRTGKKSHVIMRTSSNEVDLGGVANELGGGGHRKAASFTVNESNISSIKKIVLETLKRYVNRGVLAKDIMSSPVRVVYSDMTIGEVNKIMERTGHNGLPVIEGNRLVGIVTKKAVDKAMNHGMQNHPVKAVMSSKLIVVDANTPLSKVRQIMVENDIGRIPVLENGILVGIITRTDVMRSSFADAVRKAPRKAVFEEDQQQFLNVRDLLISRLPKKVCDLLRFLGRFGDELNLPTYIVGGFVRDLLMGNPNLDLDIVVERDGLDFTEYAARKLDATLVKHEKFLTASLFLKDGTRIDVATARTEYYEAPTELPQVEVSTIKKDLYRRDFTINAMAIKLNQKDFGLLLDFFGAKKDLENKIVRCLHTLSFVEDPTRILRAVRFERRFDFRIEERTSQLMLEATRQGYLEKVSGQRLRQEFEKILEESKWLAALKRLSDFEVIKRMFPGVFYTLTMEQKLRSLADFLPWAEEFFGRIERFYAVMFVFLEYHGDTAIGELKERYGLSNKFVDELKLLKKMIVPLSKVISNKLNFSDIYKMTKGISPEGFCYIASYLDPESQEYLKQFLIRQRETKLKHVDGRVIAQNFGLKPSKLIGELIEEVYCAKLDGSIGDEQEMQFAEKKLKDLVSSKAPAR
jgi:tRNA nucleotidyltransferase (CCA-adding enzyme)